MTVPTKLASSQLFTTGLRKEEAEAFLRAEAQQAAIAAAQAYADAQAAQLTADGKNKTYYQTSAPTASATGDIWFDTDDNYKPYRWDGGAWVSVRDIAPHTFFQTSAPTAISIGDLWFDTDDGFKPYRWDGAAWVTVQDADIATAQTTADGKNKTFYQTSAPTATATGDLWFDTDDNFKPYRWDGAAWQPVRDGAIAIAQSAAVAAQSTADGKNKTFYQTSAPTASAVGDLWFDTDDNWKPYRWSGSAWDLVHDASPIPGTEIQTGAITTNHMTSNTIDGNRITAGTLDAGKIVAGSIDVSRMAADSITAKQLAITNFDNLCFNPGFETSASSSTADKWDLSSGTPTIVAGGRTPGAKCLQLPAGGGVFAVRNLNDVKCEPGQTYYAEAWFDGTGVSSGGATVRLRGKNAAGTEIWTLESATVAPTGFTKTSVTGIVPASVATVNVEIISRTPVTAAVKVDDVFLRRLDDGSLIVDGAISTNHMTANTINGDRITGGTLDAGKIVAGTIQTDRMTANTINGDRITGGTMQANKIVAGTISAAELGTDSVIASKIQAGAIVADKLSANQIIAAKISQSLTNFHNLWPNPTSEIDPPGSYSPPNDGTDGEYDFRSNQGAGAFAGSWVRRIQRTTAGTTVLRLRVPASPGEFYGFKNQHRYISTGGTPTAKTKITFLDSGLGALSGAVSATHPVPGSPPGVWTPTAPLFAQGPAGIGAPSATAYVEFALELTTAASGTAEIHWDALNAYKVIIGDDLGPGWITPDRLTRVSAIYTTNAGQSISDSAWTTVNFGTSEKSSAFVTTGASWHFSVPGVGPPSGAGLYLVTAVVTLDTGGIGSPVDTTLRVVKNGTEIQRGNRMTGNGELLSLQLSAMLQCAATDQFHVDIWQANVGGACNLEAQHVSNRICVVGPIDD